jgi:hypothetical protein
VPRLYLGLRVNVTHFQLQGEVTHLGGLAQNYVAGTAASQDRLAGDGGMIVKVAENVTLRAVYVQGARWNAGRNATTLNGAGDFVATLEGFGPFFRACHGSEGHKAGRR